MHGKFKFEVVPITEVPFSSQGPQADGRTILVVDDERLIADSLSTILRARGFSVLTAYEGKTALHLAAECAPHLLISDIWMPVMNGVHLAMALLEMVPECKVLLFSGHATEADVRLAREAGHRFPLLTKPVHPLEMLREVNGLLGMTREEKPHARWGMGSIHHRMGTGVAGD